MIPMLILGLALVVMLVCVGRERRDTRPAHEKAVERRAHELLGMEYERYKHVAGPKNIGLYDELEPETYIGGKGHPSLEACTERAKKELASVYLRDREQRIRAEMERRLYAEWAARARWDEQQLRGEPLR